MGSRPSGVVADPLEAQRPRVAVGAPRTPRPREADQWPPAPRAHPQGDEALEGRVLRVQHAERGVAGAEDLARARHQPLQELLEVELAGQRQAALQEPAHARPGILCGLALRRQRDLHGHHPCEGLHQPGRGVIEPAAGIGRRREERAHHARVRDDRHDEGLGCRRGPARPEVLGERAGGLLAGEGTGGVQRLGQSARRVQTSADEPRRRAAPARPGPRLRHASGRRRGQAQGRWRPPRRALP